MGIAAACVAGFVAYLMVRTVFTGLYTVEQNERAVKTILGRAERLGGGMIAAAASGESEDDRYNYPKLRVIQPGGPYFKWPWEQVYKVSIATVTTSIAYDPESEAANQGGTVLEAVTKDQLQVGLTGQLRYTVDETNLYPYLFGVKHPIAHVMGFFVSVLRERIANFEAPSASAAAVDSQAPGAVVQGVSINDLRKNLSELNNHMERECATSAARYGVRLDAALITGIDPPHEVEAALAAINTAHNQVSAEISLAQALADQKIVQSKRAVEIETLKAQAEAEPLRALAEQLRILRRNGPQALSAYLRNVRLALYAKTRRVILRSHHG